MRQTSMEFYLIFICPGDGVNAEGHGGSPVRCALQGKEHKGIVAGERICRSYESL